jgi:hypothetical protein
MLWIFLLDRVLRASVARQGIAFDTPSSGWLSAPSGPYNGQNSRLGVLCIICIISLLCFGGRQSLWRRAVGCLLPTGETRPSTP